MRHKFGTGEAVETITKIINEWDPIVFFPMAPENEYVIEIKKICNCSEP